MSEDHPERPLLERFVLGHLPEPEMQRVSQHLLDGCSGCRQITAGLWEERGQDEDGRPRDRYDEAIDRVYQLILSREAEVARERARGRELFEEMMHHPAARQQLLVANSVRFQSRVLCETLLEEAHEAGFRNPGQSVELARLAVTVAERLAEGDRRNELDGLQALAWAQLGNACRISSDHAEAERGFATARALLDRGRVNLLETARVLDLEASFRRDQRRFTEAGELMDRVIAIYRKLGQKSLLGRSLKQKSMVCGEAGDFDGEITLLRHALELLSPTGEARTFLAARHNLISALCEVGRPREAFALLFHTRPLYLKTGDRLNLLRLRWLEGNVALGLQRQEQAAVAFREVRQAFLDLDLAYDAALASLNLAEVYVLQGRAAEVRRLADEVLDIFRSRCIHREALVALSILQQAAQAEQAGQTLIREVVRYLRQARNHPDLRFTPPSA